MLSARTFEIIWIASFATGMLFFVLQYNYSQGYIPKSPEAWRKQAESVTHVTP